LHAHAGGRAQSVVTGRADGLVRTNVVGHGTVQIDGGARGATDQGAPLQ
jgi:hypothetical protein